MRKLGLSDDLEFYDVWSLDEPSLLAHIPRPVYALLVIIPRTESWSRDRETEDGAKDFYGGSGEREPVVWFRQTIGHACGSIGLLHCAVNGPAASHIVPGSHFDRIRRAAVPLGMAERAKMLHDDEAFEVAHMSVAGMGDTPPPHDPQDPHAAHGQHFVSFVKADDGRLWELEGSRKGPLDRGLLTDDEDPLSPAALDKGLRRVIKLEQEAGGRDLRFSCIALAPRAA